MRKSTSVMHRPVSTTGLVHRWRVAIDVNARLDTLVSYLAVFIGQILTPGIGIQGFPLVIHPSACHSGGLGWEDFN
jgi:hypothetical protein